MQTKQGSRGHFIFFNPRHLVISQPRVIWGKALLVASLALLPALVSFPALPLNSWVFVSHLNQGACTNFLWLLQQMTTSFVA